MKIPRFGLNRFDARSVDAFAGDVRRAEAGRLRARDASNPSADSVVWARTIRINAS